MVSQRTSSQQATSQPATSSQPTASQQHSLSLQPILQYMIANGCVESNEFKKTIKEILSLDQSLEDITDEKVSKLVDKCNRKLTRFNMMIRSTMDDVLLKRFYVLISTVDNEITQAAHYHTPKQFEYFKLILTNIVANPRGIITWGDLESLAILAGLQTKGKLRAATSEHRTIFNDWCKRHWLINVSEGGAEYITLGVRAMAELDVFIKQKLVPNSDDLDCKNCNHISIYSVLCNSCDARYHKRCAKMSIDPDTGKCRLCN